jgi:hypothetical protein
VPATTRPADLLDGLGLAAGRLTGSEEQSRAAIAPHGPDRILSQPRMRKRDEPGRLGVVSMTGRVLPAIEGVTIAHAVGPVALAGGTMATAKANPEANAGAGGHFVDRRRAISSLAWRCCDRAKPCGERRRDVPPTRRRSFTGLHAEGRQKSPFTRPAAT